MSERPVLRIVRGEPTAEELAALVALLAARGAGEPPRVRPRPPWADPSVHLGLSPRPGPGAWRRSALPR